MCSIHSYLRSGPLSAANPIAHQKKKLANTVNIYPLQHPATCAAAGTVHKQRWLEDGCSGEQARCVGKKQVEKERPVEQTTG